MGSHSIRCSCYSTSSVDTLNIQLQIQQLQAKHLFSKYSKQLS